MRPECQLNPLNPHEMQPSLTCLRLGRGSALSPRGWRWVGSLSGLRLLDLTDAPLCDVALASWTGLTALTGLSLRGCTGLGDAGMRVLSSFHALREADLSLCWRLTDATLRALGTLPDLQKLDLTGCERFGAPGLRALCELGCEGPRISRAPRPLGCRSGAALPARQLLRPGAALFDRAGSCTRC